MSDYFTMYSAEQAVPCSVAEFNKAARKLEKKEDLHGFEVDYLRDGLFLFAEENGTSGELPAGFLKYLGELIVKAGMPYLELGCAAYCSKVHQDSCHGGAMRIYPDGSIAHAELHFEPHTSNAKLKQAKKKNAGKSK